MVSDFEKLPTNFFNLKSLGPRGARLALRLKISGFFTIKMEDYKQAPSKTSTKLSHEGFLQKQEDSEIYFSFSNGILLILFKYDSLPTNFFISDLQIF